MNTTQHPHISPPYQTPLKHLGSFLLIWGLLLWGSGSSGAQKSPPLKTTPTIPQPRGVNPLDMDVETYVLGNTLLTLYHEIGHGLVALGQLPILGREEDAVDAFALVELVTQLNRAPMDGLTQRDLVAYGYASIDQWLKAGAEEGAPLASDYFGAHSLNYQRYFQSACLLYGGSRDQFSAIPEVFDISEAFLETCKRQYFAAYDGWSHNLYSFDMLETDYGGENDLIFDILPAERQQHARWQTLIETSGLLDAVQQHISASFRLSQPIKVTFESCEEENAFYYLATHAISLCYELMNAYARHHGQDTRAILRTGL